MNQATGSSPSVGVRLSSFDDGVSRSLVASVAQRIVVCRCVRTKPLVVLAGRLSLAQRHLRLLAMQRRRDEALQKRFGAGKPSWPAAEGQPLP
jgi:hypothetical protein